MGAGLSACLLVSYESEQGDVTHPRGQAAWTMELSGVQKRREVSRSGPGGWTVDLVSCQGRAGALSSRRRGRGVAKHLRPCSPPPGPPGA